MSYILEGLKQGAALLLPPSSEILQIVALSLAVSGAATLLAALAAVPVSLFLALKEFRGKRLLVGLVNTAMSVPAVLIGLLVYGLVSRRGPLGILGLLFTPGAMVLAQALLAFPLITALALAALKGIARDARDLALSLGANRRQLAAVVIRQGRFAFLTAIIAGFSRVIGETGMTLMIGGNIKGQTRVLTTAISLETMKGNFELGIALGIVLLLTALAVNVAMQGLQGK
ncbi:MAG: ABC transporter permease [Candidatus Aminicenantes bacterium]|nr:ABC transporter permease [Acidobacteriota bacterium]MCG2810585.1 ABC transporter permease [Candidatus Aminicenantes bacterium]MCJ7526346.1 ABC transporter permease [Candidatus Aminicenantes bacterium]